MVEWFIEAKYDGIQKNHHFFHRSFSHMKVLVKIIFHPWVDSPLPSCQPSMPSKGLWHPPLESPLVITRHLDWHLALPGVVVIWDHPSSPLGSTNENSLIWGPWLLAHLGDVKPMCLRWACLQKIQHSLPCFLTTPCLRSQGWWETRETENRLFTLWHWAPWHVLVQFSSVAQSCPTLCDPMYRSMPGLPVHHQLLEST